MHENAKWILFAALFVAACVACVFFSRGRSEFPSLPPMDVSAPPAPRPFSTPAPTTEPVSTIIPLPTGFSLDQTVHPNDVRGGNAGLLSFDPHNRGGWLWLGIP